jgi:hypothetical protein
MFILVPWKPVVFVWLLLSAMLFFGYVGQSLTEGRNPFVPRGFYIDPVDHMGHIAHHRRYAHKPAVAARTDSALSTRRTAN